jgi:hypothetical protein
MYVWIHSKFIVKGHICKNKHTINYFSYYIFSFYMCVVFFLQKTGPECCEWKIDVLLT